MSLADRITVNTQYTRSTNVERDRGSRAIIDAYLPSAGGVELLDDIADALGRGDQPRAWSLVGPYGSGKSSFALFLHELLGEGSARGTARKVLAAENPAVARRFSKPGPWCRVVVSGSEESMPSRLLAAFDEAASAYWAGKPGRKPGVLDRIRSALARGSIADSVFLQLVDDLQDALENAGAGGLLVLIDELGKFLEHEARQGGAGIFLLQQLAERAFSGRKTNLLLVVMLHQGFDLYARGLGEKLRNDWAKVQGRFQTVSFIEPAEQVLRIVAAAFSNNLVGAERRLIHDQAAEHAKMLAKAKALPPALDPDAATDIFAQCYPIHPVGLLLLPDLCQRFAQNERTLFSYLGSREPHGFRDSLVALREAGDWLPPATVYDYFVRNQLAVLSDPLTHRRWAEVVTAVDRAALVDSGQDAARPEHAPSALAKTVGLLNLVTRADGLKASAGVLRLLYPRGSQAYASALRRLRDASVLQYRRFSGEYRVWQGTDFDIEERTATEAQKLGRFGLAETLVQRASAAPVVARRHSAESGTLRYFDVVFADPDSRRIVGAGREGAPRIVFILAEQRDHEAVFHAMRSEGPPGEIWALHRDGALIRSVVAEVMALEAVQRAAQELASDPVATREIRERLGAARAAERAAVAALLGEPDRSEWFRGSLRLDVGGRRGLQRELSVAMDCLYGQSPLVRNELVNRNRLSSQAAAARNKLFRHMLEDERLPNLGIEKYPPERAIYRSILEAGRLHIQIADGWAFVPPGGRDPLRLQPAWERLDDLMAASEDAPIALDTLADALAEPPVGLRHGVFPILFLHYYLLHRYEIAFFDDGVYSPSLTYEHLERLVRRPDVFAFQRFRIEGVRADLFDEYGKALLDRKPDTDDPLPLARALVRFSESLDDYSRRTRRLPAETLRVRDALYFSKSPQKLLFEALPMACGHDPDGDLSGFAEGLRGALRELKHAQSNLVDYMRAAMCHAFGMEEVIPVREMRDVLRGRCHGLDRYTIDTEGLLTFIRRLGDRKASDAKWFAAVLLFLGRKPSAKWTDQDRDAAEYRLSELSLRLLDLEKLRLHFTSAARSRSGHEVVLVKTVDDSGPHEQVVVLSTEKKEATDDDLDDIRTRLALAPNDELRLAIIARLTREFLGQYHKSRLSEAEGEDDRRQTR